MRVVDGYYEDIDVARFDQAWRRLSSSLRDQMGAFEPWRRGYQDTISTDVSGVVAELVGDGRATVNLVLRATDVDACADTVRRRFAVSWTLNREGNRWRAAEITSRKLAGHEPVESYEDCAPAETSDADPELEEAASEVSRGELDLYPGRDTQEHPCIDSCAGDGPVGNGYPVTCTDGSVSLSGGIQGACSQHGGVAGAPPTASEYEPPASSSSPSAGGTVQVDGYFRRDGTYVPSHTRRSPRR